MDLHECAVGLKMNRVGEAEHLIAAVKYRNTECVGGGNKGRKKL